MASAPRLGSARVVWTGAVLALAALAAWPHFMAGLRGPEWVALDLVDVREGGRSLGAAARSAWLQDGGLLGAAWNWCSLQLFGLEQELSSPGWRLALPYRIENWLVLCAAAVSLGALVRRLLLPWLGSEHAQATGRAASFLIAVAPLATSAIGDLRERADLLALTFGALSAWALLLGRQERRWWLCVLAFGLLLLAAASSRAALVWPVVLGVCEYFSARRYRPQQERLRTTLTTVLIALGVVCLPSVLLSSLFADFQPALLGADSPAGFARAWIEGLGRVALPLHPDGLGPWASTLGLLVVCLALQPLFQALRSAPRLWAWVALLWLAVLAWSLALVALTASAGGSAQFGRVPLRLTSVAFAAIGLALASTALSGAWRRWLAPALVLLCALLATRQALVWSSAARDFENLQAQFQQAWVRLGRNANFLVLDPPPSRGGIEPLGEALEVLLRRSDQGSLQGQQPGQVRGSARSLSTEAFLFFAREPEFLDLRAQALVVLAPRALLEPSPGAASGREAVLVPAAQASSGPRTWRADSRSPDLDLDPFAFDALRLVTASTPSAAQAPEAFWRASESSVREGRVEGSWTNPERPREAFFELSGSLAWRLSGRVRRMWSKAELTRIEHAEVLEFLPVLEALEAPGEALRPRVEGEDWLFPALCVSGAPATLALPQPQACSLALGNLASLAFARLPLSAELDAQGHTQWRVPQAERLARSIRLDPTSPGSTSWALEWAPGTGCLARTRARIP